MTVKTFESPTQWYRYMQNSADYIGIEDMQTGMAYAIWARNAYVGIWLPHSRGFLISRYKLSPTPYLFVEHHWDIGEPHGTAKPLRQLGICPLPAELGTDDHNHLQRIALCQWLDNLETQHPPIPGWDSVGERRESAAGWANRMDRRREGK